MIVRAAGCLIVNNEGKALFLLRGLGGDYPGNWCLPGGRLEEGEDALDAAIRETKEETGFDVPKDGLSYLSRRIAAEGGMVPATPVNGQEPDGVDFCTFIARGIQEFAPKLGPEGNPEHVAYAWAPIDQPPQPLHPGVTIALRKAGGMNELQVAEAMRDGELVSPQAYVPPGQTVGNVWLFNVRISGTGTSYRNAKRDDKGKVIQEAEFVYRRPENYLTPDFLARCNGLPVIMMHPEDFLLDSESFTERTIGSIFLPFIRGDEVWGVAKIWHKPSAEMMSKWQMSTSPGVLLGKGDRHIRMEDGSKVIIEGDPNLVDHLAVCPRGVWDKGEEPSGVETTATGELDMKVKLARIDGETDAAYNKRCDEAQSLISAARADASTGGEHLDKLLAGVDAMSAKMDAMGARMDAMEKERADRADSEEEKKKADAKAACDAFKFSKADADEEGEDEEAKKKKADAHKSRRDAEEGELAKKLEESGETKEMAADKAKKRRADADEEDKKEREAKNDARADSVNGETLKELRAKIAELEGKMPAVQTNESMDAFAKVQARADSVYHQHAMSAPRPLQGESLDQYRVRLLRPMQKHSTLPETLLEVARADKASLDTVETKIYADAVIAAANPKLEAGQIIEIPSVSAAGHKITDFRCEPKSWMSKFMPTGAYGRFNPPQSPPRGRMN